MIRAANALLLTCVVLVLAATAEANECLPADVAERLARCSPELAADPPAAGASPFDPRPFRAAEKRELADLQRELCFEPSADGVRHERSFRRARILFEGARWPEAATAFRALAFDGGAGDLGRAATLLYLESLNVLGTRFDRPSCFDRMAADIDVLEALRCAPAVPPEDEACAIVTRVARDVERLRIEAIVKRADSSDDGEERHELYARAGEAYLALWRRRFEAACLARKPACEHGEEVLYNAARAFQGARALPRAQAARGLMLDARFGLAATELAKRAVLEMGSSYHALADYENAAVWYERFARESPADERAPEALSDAVVMRLGLGQRDEAVQDGELFAKHYGGRQFLRSAQIALAIAEHDGAHDRWKDVEPRVGRFIERLRASGEHETLLLAMALLGRARVALGRRAEADDAYSQVIALFPQLNTSHAAYDASELRRLGRVLTRLGDALGHQADRARDAALALDPAQRAEALDAAERAYLAVLAIRPEPPPRAVVASAEAVAAMWDRHARDLAKGGDAAAASARRRTRDAYRACADYAHRYRAFDARARRCLDWLERELPEEHPLLDELLPPSPLLATGGAGPALILGGPSPYDRREEAPKQ